jgi:hypothetical protein
VLHGALVNAKRMPVPRATWLVVVIRAEGKFGFVGDEDNIQKAILRGKLASLYQYSASLRWTAIDQLTILGNSKRGQNPGPLSDFALDDSSTEESGASREAADAEVGTAGV